MTVGEALKMGIAKLRQVNIEASALEAGVLLCHILKRDRSYLYTHPEQVISGEQEGIYLEMLQRRLHREPLQYITGHQEFMSLDFNVGPGVLIPRQDTETLVEAALEAAHLMSSSKELSILDLGTGSGCIAVSLAFYLPTARVTGVDISAEALDIAKANAEKNGVASRVRLLQGDLFQALGEAGETYDILASNPPYIPAEEVAGLQPEVREYEPGNALSGGTDGLDFYRRIISLSPQYLRPGGFLTLEVGIGQAPAVADLLHEKYTGIKISRDLAGIERVVSGYRIQSL